MPELIDIHSHLNFPDFGMDRNNVIKRSLNNGIWMINIGSDMESSKLAVEIAENYEKGVYASVGLHPNDNKNEVFDIDKYRKLAKYSKVVSIGETGIDMFRCDKNDFERQEEIFRQHIELAIELDKPLMIHCRDAHEEILNILNSYKDSKLRGNVHFFSGNCEQAQRYFYLGFSISFTGVVTFTRDYDEVIKKSPLDKIMIETDAPFVSPAPHRGKRNEPLYVKEIAKRISEIRNETYERISKTTTQNAMNLFGI